MKNIKSEQKIHLTDYLSILSKRKWVIICTFFIIVGGVTLYSFLVTPIYSATSQILIQIPSAPLQGIGEIDVSRKQGREDYFQFIYQLLVSGKVAEKVAQRTNEHFGWAASPPLSDEDSAETKTNVTQCYSAETHLANLRITPAKGFGLIAIKVFNQSPIMAAWLANLHAEVFIEQYKQNNRQQIQKKFTWIIRQLKEQKVKVEASYKKLYSYQKEQGFLAESSKNNDVIQQKLKALNAALIAATMEKEEKASVYRELKRYKENKKKIFFIPVIAQDPVIMRIHDKQILLQQQKAELAAVYGPKHSKMLELNRKIAHLAQQLDNEVRRVIQLSKEELDNASFKEQLARDAFEKQKKIAINLREKAIHYDVLQREAESNQALYDTLLTQSKKVNLSSMIESDNIYITKRAQVPFKPTRPRKALNILLAVIFSFFLGSGIAFFVEYMDKKVKTPDEVEHYLDLPVLDVLPYDNNYSKGKILDENNFIDGPASQDPYGYPCLDVLDWLPRKLQIRQPIGEAPVLLVASAMGQEGKTTILAKIAVKLGKAGFRILVADCDFQQPSLHTFFAERNPVGLSDALAQIAAIDISNGSLKECSVGDLYTLISQRRLSGCLTTTNDDQVMISLFENGRLLHVESTAAGQDNKLGMMLLKGGFLTEVQLNKALERNKRTGLPLGYILINSGFVTQKQLQGHLKLQTEEHLQRLFSWKNGTYMFEAKSIRTYENEKLFFEEDYEGIISRQSRLAGNLLFEENISALIQKTSYQNVYFVSSGNALALQDTPVDIRLLNKFIDIYKSGYDLILLDSPPIIDAADSMVLTQLADGVVFVIKSGQHTYPLLRQALQRLCTYSEVLGVMLNQVKLKDYAG